MKYLRYLVFVTAAALVLLAGLWVCNSNPDSNPRETRTIVSPARTPIALTPASPGPSPRSEPVRSRFFGYEAGEELHYEFAQSIDLTLLPSVDEFDQPEAQSEPLRLENQTAGRVTVRVYQASETGGFFGFQLTNHQLTHRNQEMLASADRESLVEDLSHEVLATLSPDGSVHRIAFTETLSAEAENYWRSLLCRWQLAYPDEAQATTWLTEENDPLGTCLVAYDREQDTITKSRIDYATLRGEAPQARQSRCDVDGEITFDLVRVPRHIEGHEETRLFLPGAPHEVQCSTRFSLRLEEVSQIENLLEVAGAKRSLFTSTPTTTLADTSTDAASNKTVAATDAEVLDQLREFEQILLHDGVRNPRAVAAMTRLAEQIRGNDHSPSLLRATLTRTDLPPHMAAALFGALGSAGTLGAQDLLREVALSDRWPDQQRLSALTSFVQVVDPGPQVDEDLRALFEARGRLSHSSLLVLGAVGDKVRATNPARFERVRGYLESVLERGDLRRDTQLAAIRALGNLGPITTPPLIERLYAGGDKRVRAAALDAVARTQDPAATRLLLTAAQSDSEETLRMEAVRRLASRQGADQALAEIVLGDAPLQVRHAALVYLGNEKGRAPDVSQVVAWVAETDASEAMRKAARKILASG